MTRSDPDSDNGCAAPRHLVLPSVKDHLKQTIAIQIRPRLERLETIARRDLLEWPPRLTIESFCCVPVTAGGGPIQLLI
jgi:hypothetical protein